MAPTQTSRRKMEKMDYMENVQNPQPTVSSHVLHVAVSGGRVQVAVGRCLTKLGYAVPVTLFSSLLRLFCKTYVELNPKSRKATHIYCTVVFAYFMLVRNLGNLGCCTSWIGNHNY